MKSRLSINDASSDVILSIPFWNTWWHLSVQVQSETPADVFLCDAILKHQVMSFCQQNISWDIFTPYHSESFMSIPFYSIQLHFFCKRTNETNNASLHKYLNRNIQTNKKHLDTKTLTLFFYIPHHLVVIFTLSDGAIQRKFRTKKKMY